MREADIRHSLIQEIQNFYKNEPALIVEELGLQHGASRIDVAVINGEIHGYEIKSDADTFERLPAQALIYNKVLDKITLVVGPNNYKKIHDYNNMIPKWWGLKVAKSNNRNELILESKKEAKKNTALEPMAIAQLLWKDEVVEILRNFSIANKELRKPKKILYEILIQHMNLKELQTEVRTLLKSRPAWRYQQQPSPYGDS
ncbi:MAG: sce7726 family protein [Hydrotalea sp.]|nr:sce7726 family protein [Hydrotalea sp.]